MRIYYSINTRCLEFRPNNQKFAFPRLQFKGSFFQPPCRPGASATYSQLSSNSLMPFQLSSIRALAEEAAAVIIVLDAKWNHGFDSIFPFPAIIRMHRATCNYRAVLPFIQANKFFRRLNLVCWLPIEEH